MQIKKYSSKLKTLTVTLGLYSLININIVFANDTTAVTVTENINAATAENMNVATEENMNMVTEEKMNVATETMNAIPKDFIDDYNTNYQPNTINAAHQGGSSSPADRTKGTREGTYDTKVNFNTASNQAIYRNTNLSKINHNKLLKNTKSIKAVSNTANTALALSIIALILVFALVA